MKRLAVSVALLLLSSSARAESPWEYAVQASAKVRSSPPSIRLEWPQDTLATPTAYAIARKAKEATTWTEVATLPGSATTWTDATVALGASWEYRIVKSSPLGYTGYGYVLAGVEAPLRDDRGGLLLVVDATFATSLGSELARLEDDLVLDGYAVTRVDVSRDDSPPSVRAAIQKACAADPKIETLFLFGHVPVPYSGDLVPDGHPEHRGAWPADVYYADLDGTWTDATVNVTTAESPRNRNAPGDGKFDPTKTPSPVELMLGRVDLANMPGKPSWDAAGTFPAEEELLRRYLKKDHAYRHKQFAPARRALIRDGFGSRDGEAFVASAFRSYSAILGASALSNQSDPGLFLSTLAKQDYLFAYGAGAGSYTSIAGLGQDGAYQAGTTIELVKSDIRAPFVLLMGSWLGDWDAQDDLLRAVLATESMGLASAWSGRPHWYLHRMGLGMPIGDAARLAQNNAHGLYQNQIDTAAGEVHVALMGDPTLRATIVAPPSNVVIEGAHVTWTKSADAVVGHHVYRGSSRRGPFVRLTTTPVDAAFDDASPDPAAPFYVVRAVALAESGSGTWFEASEGVIGERTGGVPTPSAPAGDDAGVTTPLPSEPVTTTEDAPADDAPMQGTCSCRTAGRPATAPASLLLLLVLARRKRRP